MIEKILERIAKAVTALLFVMSVTLFIIIFAIDPMNAFNKKADTVDDIRTTSVEEIEIAKPEITKLSNTQKTIAVPIVVDGDENGNNAVEEVDVIEDVVVEVEAAEVADIVDEVTPDPSEVELLAKVIYQEAGGDECCDACRRRVADVVLNRVADERYPDTIEGVLLERSQYGRYHWTGVIWPEKAKYESEKHAVERAYRIAEEVLSGRHSELYGKNYIWQAEFIQGYDNVICCGMYFGKG